MEHADYDLKLTSQERLALLDLINEAGEAAVLERLKVSRAALGRAIAGLAVRRGTVALVRVGLAARAAPNPGECNPTPTNPASDGTDGTGGRGS